MDLREQARPTYRAALRHADSRPRDRDDDLPPDLVRIPDSPTPQENRHPSAKRPGGMRELRIRSQRHTPPVPRVRDGARGRGRFDPPGAGGKAACPPLKGIAMYQFHLWLRLDNQDDAATPNDFEDWTNTGEAFLQKMSSEAAIKQLRWTNGQLHLVASGASNHLDTSVADSMRELASTMPWIFGLLYEWDDEHEALENSFLVTSVARGRCEVSVDKLLSPIVPRVMDS